MSLKFDLDFVKKYVSDYGYEYMDCIDGEYKNTKSRILLKCPNGHDYETTFGNFRKGKRCKECQKHSYSYVKEYIESFNYKLLSDEYIGVNEKLNIMCDQGHKYKASFHKFKNGKRRCPICKGIKSSKAQRKDFKDVVELFKKHDYKVLSCEDEFINTHKKLKVMCPKGHDYEVTPANFLTGYRCPICSMSSGEKYVYDFLKSKNIKFDTQYVFDDLRSKKDVCLRFDFAILSDDGNVECLIEIDGKQHYQFIGYFYNDMEEFETRKYNDNLKNEYCKKNNIPLIRIPYENINDIKNILNF